MLHGIDRVDGSRPSGFQGLVNRVDVALESDNARAVESPGTLGQAVSRSGPDCPCAPNRHFANGVGGLTKIAGLNKIEPMGQQPLINQHDAIGGSLKKNSAVMPRPASNCDVQPILTLILRILSSMLR